MNSKSDFTKAIFKLDSQNGYYEEKRSIFLEISKGQTEESLRSGDCDQSFTFTRMDNNNNNDQLYSVHAGIQVTG